MTEGTLPLIFH